MKLFYYFISFFIFLFPTAVSAEEFVVVKGDTSFFANSSTSKPVFKSEKGKRFTLSFVTEKKGRTRVVFKAIYRGPYSKTGNLRGIELDLWVDSASIEEVNLETIHRKYADGSEVDIAAGMVIQTEPKTGVFVTNSSLLQIDLKGVKKGKHFDRHDLRVTRRQGKSLKSAKGIAYGKFHYNQPYYLYVSKENGKDVIQNPFFRIKGKLKGVVVKLLGGGGIGLGMLKPFGLFPKEGAKVMNAQGVVLGVFTNSGVRGIDWKKAKPKGELVCSLVNIDGASLEICTRKKDLVMSKSQPKKREKKSRVKLGKVKTTGCSKKSVARQLRPKINTVRYCYDRQRRRQPSLAGRLSMQWTIVEGKVPDVAMVTSTLGDKTVVKCVSRVLKRTRYKDVKKCTVNASFHFNPPK